MTAEHANNLGKMTALLSFIIGTGIFVSFFATSNFNIAFAGFYYLGFAFPVNFIILFIVTTKAINNRTNQEKLITTSGLMLLNIPIAAFYVFIFLGFVRNAK